ncbi:lysoplasmalogenase family protein [Microbacterium sp. XT11]|uniref:lysoplasmalogenase family protein n=1 Tax=Microbacterium sp. XT11 TaxID=367477 RepID=UPI000836CEBF|nr:lysoplasmalogenase family protein [Microbacterium sp. XT11]
MSLRTVLWAFVPYAMASAVHVVLLAMENPLAAPTKLILMPLLAVPVLLSIRRARRRVSILLILTALLFSWLRAAAGSLFPDTPELPLMLGFFGVAHIAYIVLFARFLGGRRMPWWALAYAAWWIVMMFTLGPHTGALLPAVGGYGVVLAGTAAMAARCSRLIAAGGALFLLSDTILAFRLFLPDAMPSWTSPAVMSTYTLGQGLLIAGALVRLHEKAAR